MSTSTKNSNLSKPQPEQIERCDFLYVGVAIVSTAHLVQGDSSRILDLDNPWLSHIYADGAASLFQLPEPDQYARFTTSTERFGLSEAFRNVCFGLSEDGFKYVCFDRDGPTYKRWHTFDW